LSKNALVGAIGNSGNGNQKVSGKWKQSKLDANVKPMINENLLKTTSV